MIKNLGLNLSPLNYYISKSIDKTEIIYEYQKIVLQKKLSGLEFYPSTFFKIKNKKKLEKICKDITSKKLFYILDCNKIFDLKAIKSLIPFVKIGKKKILVIKLTNILECKRHLIKKDWKEFISDAINFLKKIEPIARDNNIKIAIENHQDLDSNDLISITDPFEKDNTIGINFDIGNAFAVCEDPLVFCKKIIDRINNVHIKDYRIYRTKEGFMLSSCPIGSGAVNFKSIMKLLNKKNPFLTKMLEPGQLQGRHIKKNHTLFWRNIGTRLYDENKIFNRTLINNIKKNKDKNFYSPIEKKMSKMQIIVHLKKQIIKSIEFGKLL